jgi:hypothetical protein
MLSCHADTDIETFGIVLQCEDDRTQLNCFRPGAENYEDFMHVAG